MRDHPQIMAMQQLQGSGAGQMTTKSYAHLSAGNVGAITTLMIRDMFADHELPVDEAVFHKYEDLAHKILIHLRVEPQSTPVTDAMVDAALNAWFKSPPSETDQGLERSMKAALTAALTRRGNELCPVWEADHVNKEICDSYALENQRFHDRIKALENALREIDNMAPATCEVTLAHQMADIARAALEQDK